MAARRWKANGRPNQPISNMPSTSTAASAGREGTPIVLRAWRPASPNTATARSEAPFITCACWVKSGQATKPFAASQPENRLVARTLENKLEAALADVAREQRALAVLEHARPAPLTDAERQALARLARDLPRLWAAKTTTDRDRKELLRRALIGEIIVTVRRPENIAEVELFWEGGARSVLSIKLIRRGGESIRTSEGTIALIARLAAHHPDQQIASILNRQGRRTGTGMPFTATRVKGVRQRAGIPTAPPPDPDSETVSIERAAAQLNASTATVRRWLREGLLPGEQVTPTAPWRIRLDRRDPREVRARHPGRISAARRGCQAPRRGAANSVASGPTRPATRGARHHRPSQRPENPGAAIRSWTVCTVTNAKGAV